MQVMIDAEIAKTRRENEALKQEIRKNLDEMAKLFEQSAEVSKKAKADFRRVVCDEETPVEKVVDTLDNESVKSGVVSFSLFVFPPTKSVDASPKARHVSTSQLENVNLDDVTFFGW